MPCQKRIILLAVKPKIWLFNRHNRFSFWDSHCAAGIGLLSGFFSFFLPLLKTGVRHPRRGIFSLACAKKKKSERSVYSCRANSVFKATKDSLWRLDGSAAERKAFFLSRCGRRPGAGRRLNKRRTNQSTFGARENQLCVFCCCVTSATCRTYLSAPGRPPERKLNRVAPRWPIEGALKIPGHQLFRLRRQE